MEIQMKRMRKMKLPIITLCMIAMLLSIPMAAKITAKADSDSQKIVKVGYIGYKGFIEEDGSGNYSGYAVEYLNEIAKYTGWKYEYVYGTWEEQLDALKRGKIDIVCQAQMTPERKKKYLFSKYSVGMESNYLYVLDKNDKYYYNDFAAFDGIRVGMMKGSYQNEAFDEYAKANHFSYTPVVYKTVSEVYTALEEKKVDAVAVGSLSINTKYRNICQFGAEPFYIMAAKNNQELLNELDNVLGQIKSLNQSFESELYTDYYGKEASKSPIAFSREEADWIAQKKTITISLIPNHAPFSYINDKGKMEGITKDVMDLVAKKSGIKMKFKMLKKGQSSMDYLSKNPTDFIAGVSVDNPYFDSKKYLVSDNYYSDDVVLVSNPDQHYDVFAKEGTYTLAVPTSYTALIGYVKKNYPQFKVRTFPTNEACFQGVKDGKADFMAQNINIVNSWMQKPRYNDMTILPSYIMQEKIGIVGTKNSENAIILAILNKAIANVTSEEKEQCVVNRTVENHYKLTTMDFLYKFRLTLIVGAVLLFILFAGIIIFWEVRKRNYDRLAKFNHSLEIAVKKADSANAAKSQFLAQMSHEIRTPMNAVIGLTDIAKMETEPNEKIRDYLDKIADSSKLLLGIINDVLDMSAIEGGKLKIDSAEYNFKKQISNITTMFYQQAHQKNIRFEVKMKGVTEEVVGGDQLRVNQILMNLLSNAIKFTPAGGSVSLSVIQASRARDHVQFRFIVTDTGCGMSEEMLGRLFKPFEQESASTARKHGGSGLGLSIAKNLTEMMGGTIDVESEVGLGTTFTVDIPFVLAKNAVHYDDKVSFDDVRTLVVDDDPDACDYTGTILKRLGVRYDYAMTGEEALMMLGDAEDQKDPYKLCMIDWKMPEMDGIEVTKQIREVFGDDAIVIIVSAYDISEVERIGKDAGVNYYITKPMFQSTLFKTIMEISKGNYKQISAKEQDKKYDFTGRHVLIAEDVALNMEVAIKLLSMVGVGCTCAEDGKQAVEIYEQSKEGYYDAIFLDINMPVMDGYEAAKRIRKSNKKDAQTVPIYAMTANAFAEDVTNALNAGMNGHLAKPIETKVLYSVLDQLWKK